ncbi:stigma-specific STIG1-like protein 1 [Cucurbita pepo subsp. pepo]|uniref:stigma-specific STIG1-like protein 1 n=1 Tax=Cucurbita pepo subsp. pepo TaxID=3664 RepID=UPI000C9D5891|nr:stigma-specific STIG1-like protein 1 [Cucurbita pepo subsp. pepo]
MRSFVRLLFVVALALALLAPVAMARAAKEELKVASVWGRGGFFSYRYRPYQAAVTCDRSIKVCRAKGSRGRNCCKKMCVDLKTDRYNCGKCGKKCKYSEICCKGKCVNPMFNRNNCGGCNNKCSRGSSCVYGMCGYA